MLVRLLYNYTKVLTKETDTKAWRLYLAVRRVGALCLAAATGRARLALVIVRATTSPVWLMRTRSTSLERSCARRTGTAFAVVDVSNVITAQDLYIFIVKIMFKRNLKI